MFSQYKAIHICWFKYSIACTLYQGEVWVSGGKPEDPNKNLQDVEIYKIKNTSWRPGPILTKARSAHSIHVVSHTHIVAGGMGGWTFLETLNITKGVWTEEETFFAVSHLWLYLACSGMFVMLILR